MANKIEEIKREKDGLDVLPDLHRYAAAGVEAIEAGDFERLKWYGLFHRKATPGYFMLRMRIPNGVATSEQVAAVGEMANMVGRGAVDVTTRQNLQLRWIRIEDAPWVLQRLAAAGLNSQQTGMDNVRNVVGCPLAGIDRDELIDTRTLAARLQQAIVGGKRFSNLPRKFNLSITGCRDDCGHAQTHDLSFVPATRDGQAGFNILVGGALGGMNPQLAEPLDAFVAPSDAVDAALAVLDVFRDHGLREKRKESRLKWLLGQWGMAKFRDAVEAQLGRPLARAGAAAQTRHGGDHIGVGRQRQDDLRVIGCLVPVGRTTGDDLIEFARLAKVYGTAELRLTVQQNVLIPNVPSSRIEALLAEPLLQTYRPDPSPFTRALVSCTGKDYCIFSLIDTKGEALKLAQALESRYQLAEGAAAPRIQLSGCRHACGQHRAGEIGLLGGRKRVDGQIIDTADIFVGGRLGDDARLGAETAKQVPTDDLAEAVADQIRCLRGPDALIERPG